MAALNNPLVSPPRRPSPPPPSAAPLTVDDSRRTLGQQFRETLQKCTHLSQLKQAHAQMLRLGLFSDPSLAGKLFAPISLPPISDLTYAQKLFDQIPQPNIFTFNTFIRAYACADRPSEGLHIFLRLLHEYKGSPDKFTFPFVFKASGEACNDRFGRAAHGMFVKMMKTLGSDLFILNSLIHFYSSCGDVGSAYRVFLSIEEKDTVSWNSMIASYAQCGCPDEALELFDDMEKMSTVQQNERTMMGVLSACAQKGDWQRGRTFLESYLEKSGVKASLTLNSAVLAMYAKCGKMDLARSFFNSMEQKDVISWTTLLTGYARVGDCDEAERVFTLMPYKDMIAWSALISAYAQNGRPNEALRLFQNLLQEEKHMVPNEVTIVGALSACAQLGAIDLGGWIHVYIKKRKLELDCHLATSLIDMYSKCGHLEKAQEVFNSVRKRDVFVYSATIGGLAMHGRGEEAVELFKKMQEDEVQPDSVTFTNLLSACSHSGLVDEGKTIFEEMDLLYNVVPDINHYACMVHILGRAGRFDEAMQLIDEMPMEPNSSVWKALLGCQGIHSNVNLAERAFHSLVELEPENHGAYVLMSNVYAKQGNWDKVSELRKDMRESGMKKEPGFSSIEVGGKVHQFLVGDNSHPSSKRLYSKLDEIVKRLRAEEGYEPDKSQLLQVVDEEDMEQQALYFHSEKLAIAFGLLDLEPDEPIRVFKNLRICGDCHLFMKMVSKVYNREIVIRDWYRFHHFKDGSCSCKDYW